MKRTLSSKYKRFSIFTFLIGFIIISIVYVNLTEIHKLAVNSTKQNIQIAASEYVIYNSNLYSNYTLSPISDSKNFGHFGAFITGIDICNINLNIDTQLIPQLVNDMYKYKFVILKKQCSDYNYKIPANILEHFGAEFGETSEYYIRSPTDPEGTNISVLANNESIGIFGWGARPWHVDGLWDIVPKSICLQHIVKIPNIGGGTQITDTTALLKLLKQINIEFYNELHKLYVVYYSPTLEAHIVYPFIGIQPFTNEKYMILNSKIKPPNMRHIIQVNNKSFIDELETVYIKNVKVVKFKGKGYYRGDNRIQFYKPKQIENFINKIEMFIDNEGKNNNVYYLTEYEAGDLLVRDNLQLLHSSHPTCQMSADHVGLRILWRLCINGKEYPTAAF